MPRTPFLKKVEEFIGSQSLQRGWKEDTKRRYRNLLLKVRKEFHGRKPSALEGEEILHYAEEKWGDLTPKGKKWYWNVLKNFLEYCGSSELEKIKFNIGNVKDREVYWLDEHKAGVVRDVVEKIGGEHLMIYHLGRDLGLRRCEMRWLKLSDVKPDTENVVVPGKYDKQRVVPFHPLTQEYLQIWKENREEKRRISRSP